MRNIVRNDVTFKIASYGLITPTLAEKPVISGTIRHEARRVPSTTATLTVAANHVSQFDPRAQLGLQAQIIVRTGTDTDPQVGDQGHRWNLYVTNMRRGFKPGTIDLTASSNERYVMDYAPDRDNDYSLLGSRRLRSLVNTVLGTVNGDWELEAEPSVDPIVGTNSGTDPAALVWTAGQDGYSFLQPLCQARGLRLYCDEQERWTLRGADYIDTSRDGYIIREGANLIDGSLTDSIDQPGWCDAAVTRYVWRGDAGAVKTTIDAYSSPNSLRRVVATTEKQTPFPGAGYSEYLVNRRQARGRTLSAQTQATWTERPDQSVALIMNDGTMTVGAIDAVGFDLTTGVAAITAYTADSFPGTWIGEAGVNPDQTWDQAATIYPTETWDTAAGRTT